MSRPVAEAAPSTSRFAPGPSCLRNWVTSIRACETKEQKLQRILSGLPSIVGATAAGVTLAPASGSSLRDVTCRLEGGPEWFVDAALAFGLERDPILAAMLAGHVAVHDGTVFEEDRWHQHAMFVELAEPSGLHHYLVAPCLNGDRLLGWLVFLRAPSLRRFSDREALLAQAAGSHIVNELRDLDRCARRRLPRHSACGQTALWKLDRHAMLLDLVAKGLTNSQIATCLDRSPHTVRHQLEQLFAAAGASSRAELTALWIHHRDACNDVEL